MHGDAVIDSTIEEKCLEVMLLSSMFVFLNLLFQYPRFVW